MQSRSSPRLSPVGREVYRSPDGSLRVVLSPDGLLHVISKPGRRAISREEAARLAEALRAEIPRIGPSEIK